MKLVTFQSVVDVLLFWERLIGDCIGEVIHDEAPEFEIVYLPSGLQPTPEFILKRLDETSIVDRFDNKVGGASFMS